MDLPSLHGGTRPIKWFLYLDPAVRWSSNTHWRSCWSWRWTSELVGPIHSPHRNQNRSRPALTNPPSSATLSTSLFRDCTLKKTLRDQVQTIKSSSLNPLREIRACKNCGFQNRRWSLVGTSCCPQEMDVTPTQIHDEQWHWFNWKRPHCLL